MPIYSKTRHIFTASFDLDSVLVSDGIVEQTYKDFSVPLPDKLDYEFEGAPSEITSEIRRRFHDPLYNRDPKLLFGACEAISLAEAMGLEPIIVTARPKSIEEVTRVAVRRYFPAVKKIYFTEGLSKKNILLLEDPLFHMDDHPGHLSELIGTEIMPILVTNPRTPWNHDFSKLIEGDGLPSGECPLSALMSFMKVCQKRFWAKDIGRAD